MSAQTGISWCDSTSCLRAHPLVLVSMAGVAEGDPVVQIEPKLRRLRPRPLVVGVQISTTSVAAMLASEVVSQLHVIRPLLRSICQSLATAFGALAIDVSGARGSSQSDGTHRRTDSRALGNGARPSAFLADEAGSASHASTRLFRVLVAAFRRRHAFALDAHLYATARLALRAQTVVSRAIDVVGASRLPRLARPAPLLTGSVAGQQLRELYASAFRQRFHRALGGLSHG